MGSSPWASHNNTSTKNHNRDLTYAKQRAVKLLGAQLERLDTWGQSHANRYLYTRIHAHPDIPAQKHLYSAHCFRTVHDLAHSLVYDIMANESVEALHLDTIAMGCVSKDAALDEESIEKRSIVLGELKDIVHHFYAHDEPTDRT